MYKTIRHGENSLQYKILPQNDDFRIEGKLSTAESSCSSSSRSKSKSKRPKRRSFFAYLGLIFVCTVIVGAVLIPFLVSAECLPNPTEWFLKTKAALTHSASDPKQANETTATAERQIQYGSNGINVGKTVKIIHSDGVEKIVLKVNKTTTTQAFNKTAEQGNGSLEPPPTISKILSVLNKTQENETKTFVNAGETNEIHDIGKMVEETENAVPATTNLTVTSLNSQPREAIEPIQQQQQRTTTTTTTTSYSQPQQQQPPPQGGYVNSPHAPSSGSQSNTSAPAVPTIMTRIIQVPLLKATAKKPIMPPVLAKTNSPTHITKDDGGAADKSPPTNVDDINVVPTIIKHNQNSDWIKTHWPYIDPSTYFQWTGYKAEDSVLLPALLGFALIGVILIITVCLVARNKRTIVSSVRRRNRNDIEETEAEDNTTLLTSTNLSDED